MLHLARNLKNNTLVAQNVIKQDNQVWPDIPPTTTTSVNSVQLFCNCVWFWESALSLSEHYGQSKTALFCMALEHYKLPLSWKSIFCWVSPKMWCGIKQHFVPSPAPARILLVFKTLTLYDLFQTLTQSLKLADHNFEKLKNESDRLEQHAKKSVNWLLWLMLIVVCFIFISMILFIRIFPKLRWFLGWCQQQQPGTLAYLIIFI